MILSYKEKTPKIGKNVFIAPTATIVGDVEIGDGVNIWYGAVVRGDTSYVKIGRNSNIQDNCTVHTDTGGPTLIGENVTVGHGAVIHACILEDRCLIGIGAIVVGPAHIKTGTIIAAGSLIVPGQNAGPHQMLVGAPAVVKRAVSADDAELIDRSAKKYTLLAKDHQSRSEGNLSR